MSAEAFKNTEAEQKSANTRYNLEAFDRHKAALRDGDCYSGVWYSNRKTIHRDPLGGKSNVGLSRRAIIPKSGRLPRISGPYT